MSLVAYDSSDDSEEDKIYKKTSASQMKTKESVKIRIPSLKEFKDDDDDDDNTPEAKKPKLQSGSGLFSLLPPPVNSTLNKPGFVPHVFSSKKEQSTFTSLSKNYTNNKTIPANPALFECQESGDNILTQFEKSEENATSAPNDFFWLDDLASSKKSKQEDENSFSASKKNNSFLQNLSSQLPPMSSSSLSHLYPNASSEASHFYQYQKPSETVVFQSEQVSEPSVKQSSSLENYSNEYVNPVEGKESLLKDKEFLKLQGRKHEFENIDIIDVNADDQLTDKNEWLIKNLTEEPVQRPSRKKHNLPTQQQKRKHQITYLAFQAKERENDLKNQWALNSRTRRETQAKYGF